MRNLRYDPKDQCFHELNSYGHDLGQIADENAMRMLFDDIDSHAKTGKMYDNNGSDELCAQVPMAAFLNSHCAENVLTILNRLTYEMNCCRVDDDDKYRSKNLRDQLDEAWKNTILILAAHGTAPIKDGLYRYFRGSALSIVAARGEMASAGLFHKLITTLDDRNCLTEHRHFWFAPSDTWNYMDTQYADHLGLSESTEGGYCRGIRTIGPVSIAIYYGLLYKDTGASNEVTAAIDKDVAEFRKYSEAIHRVTKVFDSTLSVSVDRESRERILKAPDGASLITIEEAKERLYGLLAESEWPALEILIINKLSNIEEGRACLELVAQKRAIICQESLTPHRNIYYPFAIRAANKKATAKTLAIFGVIAAIAALLIFLLPAFHVPVSWHQFWSFSDTGAVLKVFIFIFIPGASLVALHGGGALLEPGISSQSLQQAYTLGLDDGILFSKQFWK